MTTRAPGLVLPNVVSQTRLSTQGHAPRRSSSTPVLSCKSSSLHFYPSLPRVACNTAAMTARLHDLDGRPVSFVIIYQGAGVRITIARFAWSLRRARAGNNRVPCVCLKYIEVAEEHRSRGHAHRTITLLSRLAADLGMVLIVQDVISEHMHALCRKLGGRVVAGHDRDVNYWMPPPPDDTTRLLKLWQPHPVAVIADALDQSCVLVS